MREPRDRRLGTAQSAALEPVLAAQKRASEIRWSLGKMAFGLVFFIGALAHSFTPNQTSSSTALWIALLLLSTLHVGMGMRGIARVRGRGLRLWLPLTLLWGFAASIVLRMVQGR